MAESRAEKVTGYQVTVYNADGSVLYDETWNTSYRGEYREIRVGTKPKPKPEPEPPKKGGKEKPAPPEAPPAGTTTTGETQPPATTQP